MTEDGVVAEVDRVIRSWQPDRRIYIRDHVLMAVALSVLATLVLFLLGNPDFWVGAVGACLAIAVRGGYLASEELGLRWDLSARAITATSGRSVALRDLDKVRTLGSAVQLITRDGNKQLIRYMADPAEVQRRIAETAGVSER
ncbi:hypothetical protein CLV78_103198 [Aliiruegeria haliotis]|uniref:PH (Pleckstrin Homology) domain-containing protein n=1 Tax=Aliiruegeria haliotis TaxID=1280846 RepID=A0A2T0RT59_9RHOB|nr:hypothetical protein [Aliiruegeria haliotis]PRY24332.1 hypothetical protein CLV78_103198 [Aliiruegeria haliotis]